MPATALFVRHRARPGQREQVQRVWSEFVQPRVAANDAHESYYFCFDDEDPDVVCVFQLLSDADAVGAFLSGPWYPEYLEKVGEHVAEAPQIHQATPQWIKGS